jgi:hypothetical protein
VRQKLRLFDALDGIAYELTKFLALFLCNQAAVKCPELDVTGITDSTSP